MLQTILYILVGIIVLALLLASVLPKDFTLNSIININRSSKVVFDYVKLIKNQEYYSKWVMTDPNIKLTYTGTDGTVGFKSAWSSEVKNVGVGEQEITNIVEGQRYDVEIRFEKPFKGISTAFTTTEGISETQTKVTTTFKSTSPFPMNLLTNLFLKSLQKDMDENSATLKKVLENT